MPEIRVADNRDRHRYEALVDGEVAGVIFYREGVDRLILVHTEVGEEWEGKGVAGKLVSGTLDQIRERGLRIEPVCAFVRAYLARHPEYADLVAE